MPSARRTGLQLPGEDRIVLQGLEKRRQGFHIFSIQRTDYGHRNIGFCQDFDCPYGPLITALLPVLVVDFPGAVQRNRDRFDIKAPKRFKKLLPEQKSVRDNCDADTLLPKRADNLRPVLPHEHFAADQVHALAGEIRKLPDNRQAFFSRKLVFPCFSAGRSAVFAGETAGERNLPDDAF